MLIKAASLRDGARLTDIARMLREHGRNAIWVASDLLTGSSGSSGSTGSSNSVDPSESK